MCVEVCGGVCVLCGGESELSVFEALFTFMFTSTRPGRSRRSKRLGDTSEASQRTVVKDVLLISQPGACRTQVKPVNCTAFFDSDDDELNTIGCPLGAAAAARAGG